MDDETAVSNVIRHFLMLKGYEVKVTSDGTETIEAYMRAREGDNPFDLVILDLTIPGGMGGLEAMEKLVKSDPHVKAIVSSGYSKDPVIHDYKNYGFKGVLIKPYKVEELEEMVEKTLA